MLHDLARGDLDEVLQPVLAAQEAVEPSVEVSFATEKALDALTGAKGERGSYWDPC